MELSHWFAVYLPLAACLRVIATAAAIVLLIVGCTKRSKKKAQPPRPNYSRDTVPDRSQPPSSAGGGGDGQGQGGSKRLQQTQAQVDEVVTIMRSNVEKVLERDDKLTHLDTRADALQEGASQFEKSAATLKRKYWWQNMKMMIIMAIIAVIVVLIIIVYFST